MKNISTAASQVGISIYSAMKKAVDIVLHSAKYEKFCKTN